jgi:hypothetical protein
MSFETKDSGKHVEYVSGMRRDSDENKPRFDLLLAENVPFENQFLTRVADLLYRGSLKYTSRNWEQASSIGEVERMKASAFRHFVQYLSGDTSEDHASAAVVNLLMAETTTWKIDNANSGTD